MKKDFNLIIFNLITKKYYYYKKKKFYLNYYNYNNNNIYYLKNIFNSDFILISFSIYIAVVKISIYCNSRVTAFFLKNGHLISACEQRLELLVIGNRARVLT